MENQEKEIFSYTYSAKQQEEVNRIRRKYEQPQEDKIEQLKKLDQSATNKATSKSLAIGITGALILGIGMSLIMTDIAAVIGMTRLIAILVGIPLGVVGIIFIAFAYPVYKKTLAKERKRIAPEIIRLSDEIIK